MKNLDLLRVQKEQDKTPQEGDLVVELLNGDVIRDKDVPYSTGWQKQIAYNYRYGFEFYGDGNNASFRFNRDGLYIKLVNKNEILIPFNNAKYAIDILRSHFEGVNTGLKTGYGVSLKDKGEVKVNEMVFSSTPDRDIYFYSRDNKTELEELLYLDREHKEAFFVCGNGIRYTNQVSLSTPELAERLNIILLPYHFEGGFNKFWSKCSAVFEVQELNLMLWKRFDQHHRNLFCYRDKKPRIFFAGNKLSKIVKESRG